MGIDPSLTGGHVPLLFEAEGMPYVLSPYFLGAYIFNTLIRLHTLLVRKNVNMLV